MSYLFALSTEMKKSIISLGLMLEIMIGSNEASHVPLNSWKEYHVEGNLISKRQLSLSPLVFSRRKHPIKKKAF